VQKCSHDTSACHPRCHLGLYQDLYIPPEIIETLENHKISSTLLLLELVVDVNARDDDHSTALHLVALDVRVDVVRALLQVGDGADVNAHNND
jgi:ankyrin repeat protein